MVLGPSVVCLCVGCRRTVCREVEERHCGIVIAKRHSVVRCNRACRVARSKGVQMLARLGKLEGAKNLPYTSKVRCRGSP